MSLHAPRKSFAQILALLGVLFALSGFSEQLASLETEIFEITVTPQQAADMDYDFEITSDDLDERTEDLVEEMLDNEVDGRFSTWVTKLVYAPYGLMGLIGLLSLAGFYSWNRLLGALSLVLGVGVLTAASTVEMFMPTILDTISDQVLPKNLSLSPEATTGPAVFRLQVGSFLAVLSSLVALIRPDRRDNSPSA